MTRIASYPAGVFVIVILISASVFAQTTDLTGTWTVDLGATASQTDSYRRVDRSTVERTTTTTLGKGAEGMGTLSINPDGTYQLKYLEYDLIYKKPLISGRWQIVPNGKPFSDLKAIELFDAKPDIKYPAEERKWYVFRKDDGSVEARYPPYDGYAKIKLTRTGKTAPARATPTRTEASPARVASSDDQAPAADSTPKTWTPDMIRSHLNGKTKAQVFDILGKPVKSGYGTYYFNGVDKVFPPCSSGCNYRSFAIRFDGPGETVNSIELQYWVVE